MTDTAETGAPSRKPNQLRTLLITLVVCGVVIAGVALFAPRPHRASSPPAPAATSTSMDEVNKVIACLDKYGTDTTAADICTPPRPATTATP